jgi:hypothetical protein
MDVANEATQGVIVTCKNHKLCDTADFCFLFVARYSLAAIDYNLCT